MNPEYKISSRRNLLLNSLFFVSILLILITRILVFFKYNINIIDSDQPFMWLGASDFAKGNFYEPRYYGQSYNTFMEGLFSVPLIWLNIPVYYAVPVATHILSLFPFLFMAIYLFSKGKKIHSLFVLAILLCLPASYDLLNSLPRGFVTGLFFTSFFIVNVLNPANMRMVFTNTLLAVTGYFVNPNSTIVTVPFLAYLFFINYRNRSYYMATIPGLLAYIPLYFFFDRLYTIHPEYIINPLFIRFSTDFFMINISHLDERFTHISFFFENNCISLLIVLAALLFFLFRQDKKAAMAGGMMILVLCFSFCTGKTLEGTAWPYMSFSRMYLGIPLFICLFISVLRIRLSRWIFLFLIPVLFAAHKNIFLEKILATHHDGHNWMGVRLVPLKQALDNISFYKKSCEDHQAPFLMISNSFWLNTFVAYGGPALYPDFPITHETRYEKRFWVREKYRNEVFKTFLIISSNYNLDKIIPRSKNFFIESVDAYGLMKVTHNNIKLTDFIDIVNTFENRGEKR